MKISTRDFISLVAPIGILGSVYAVVVNGADPAVIQYIFWPSVCATLVNAVHQVYITWRDQ